MALPALTAEENSDALNRESHIFDCQVGALMRRSRENQTRITIDLKDYPEVMKAIQEAAAQMDWPPSTLLRRNLVAAFAAGVSLSQVSSRVLLSAQPSVSMNCAGIDSKGTEHYERQTATRKTPRRCASELRMPGGSARRHQGAGVVVRICRRCRVGGMLVGGIGMGDEMKSLRPFLLAVIIVALAFTPFGFWGWLWRRLWLIWEIGK